MQDNDIRYLRWEASRHRDGQWIWPETDDAGNRGPGIWGWLLVLAMLVLAMLAGPTQACGQVGQIGRVETPRRAQERSDRLYWASVMAVIGAGAADAATSYGGYELNPVLCGRDGRFRARGISIKAVITGTALLAQFVAGKRSRRLFTRVNFAVAGYHGGLAVRTVHMKRRRP